MSKSIEDRLKVLELVAQQMKYIANITDPEPTLCQELRDGLAQARLSVKFHAGCRDYIVKRIFLPKAKYEAFKRECFSCNTEAALSRVLFQDVPVFSWSGDEIIYCKD